MKFFSFNRNYTTILLTLLFVLFLGAVYFFIYIPQNEERLQEQRFRTLQNINNNIHEKIKNSIALMNNLLKGEVDTAYIAYLNHQSKENFTLTFPKGNKAGSLLVQNIWDSSSIINISNQNRQITLLLKKYSVPSEGDTVSHQMVMKFSFEQFFKFLLPQYVFDDYVIFNNGEAVYETLPFGSFLKDSLFSKNNKMVTTGVNSYTIGGKDYKLFLQPVSFIADNNITIAGLLANRRYQHERNQLPSNVILLLVTIVLVIIVCFPWIKLYQMGNKDRLTITDVIASIAVSMLLMSLLFFSFFKYNTLLRPNDSPDSKAVLAEQITTAFQKEIDTVYKRLYFIDSSVAVHAKQFTNQTGDTSVQSTLPPGSVSIVPVFKKDTSFKQVLWLRNNGDETVNWTSELKNAPLGNFGERSYFKSIMQQRMYALDAAGKYNFYLDQVISWTSGRFTSVLSIPSRVEGQAVAALSFTMKSLDHPVLPPGYHFAIMNSNGKVLYHSDQSRNLNEDLLTEFSEKDRLRSAMEARTEDVFKTGYSSRDFNVRVRPIKRLPYFIVLFSDLGYKETREMAIYSFTFSMLFLLFAFFILQLFIVFLVSSRRSFFKKQLYDTSWIGPKVSSHHQYNLAILINFFVLFLAIAFFRISSFLTYVFILLFSVAFISFFLNKIFARYYKENNQHVSQRFKNITLRSLVILVFVIDLAALKLLDWSSSSLLLLYQAICILAGLFFYHKGKSVLGNIQRYIPPYFLKRWTYARSFALMALTRLIITSGLPVAFFYISAYNYEQNISIRYRQLQYANALMNKQGNTRFAKIPDDTYDKGYYKDSVWIKEVGVHDYHPPAINSEEDSITSKILDLFRINFSDISVREDKFSIAHAADSSFFYNPLLKDACKRDSATITYRKLSLPGKFLVVKSAGLNYKLPSVFSQSRFNGFLFWMLLLLALAVFYFIIYSIINKLFCLNLPDLTLCKALDDKIIKNQKVNNLLFVIGLPGSGKLSRIKEEIKNGELKFDDVPLVYNESEPESNNVFVADLINIPDLGEEGERNNTWKSIADKALNSNHRLIIVNHFEYNIQDAITNRIKLNFLEQLMLANRSKIIILSTIHPVAFLDSVMDPAAAERSVPGQDLERWHVLLGHYRIIVFPLEQSVATKKVQYAYKALYKETEHTHFLNKIQDAVLDVAKADPQKESRAGSDELIFKLQVTSHYFYMYIWQSLTKEEKFLLYDLAEDNLVNSYDDYNLNMLLAKGVIIRRNGTLTLFNRGFRNFILTAIGNNEVMKIKNRIRDNGNWGRLKTPLLIILVATLTFLLASQREAYSELMAYIAALGAGIPAVLKLFSLFDKSGQKE